MRPPRLRQRARLPLLALLGATLGACGGTLYDAAGVPVLAAGVPCAAPNHVCGGACVSQSEVACGGACAVCPAPAGSSAATCEPAAGGDFACSYSCAAGQLRCPGGCCFVAAAATGEAHACAITEAGSLACWGANDHGQLGPGAASPSSARPNQVFPSGVTAVAAGGRHTCAVHLGAVVCWGDGRQGQLGNGEAIGGPNPVAAGLAGTAATQLALGEAHACALTGGQVTCWGANALGQLGRGDTAPAPAQKATPVASGASILAAGGDTSCAATSGGLRCWGADQTGQAGGTGGAGAVRATPGAVAGTGLPASAPLALAVGRRHACAAFGPALGLWCWGADEVGQLGDRRTTGGPAAVQARTLDNAQAALLTSAGGDFTCSAKDAVELVCSGVNDQLQAGGPGNPADKLPVALGASLVSLSSGAAFSCALVGPAGQLGVKCWGANGSGQLGRDTAGAPAATPEFVTP